MKTAVEEFELQRSETVGPSQLAVRLETELLERDWPVQADDDDFMPLYRYVFHLLANDDSGELAAHLEESMGGVAHATLRDGVALLVNTTRDELQEAPPGARQSTAKARGEQAKWAAETLEMMRHWREESRKLVRDLERLDDPDRKRELIDGAVAKWSADTASAYAKWAADMGVSVAKWQADWGGVEGLSQDGTEYADSLAKWAAHTDRLVAKWAEQYGAAAAKWSVELEQLQKAASQLDPVAKWAVQQTLVAKWSETDQARSMMVEAYEEALEASHRQTEHALVKWAAEGPDTLPSAEQVHEIRMKEYQRTRELSAAWNEFRTELDRH